jgi:hypothetical protein
MLLRSLLMLCCANALANSGVAAQAHGVPAILTGSVGALPGASAGEVELEDALGVSSGGVIAIPCALAGFGDRSADGVSSVSALVGAILGADVGTAQRAAAWNSVTCSSGPLIENTVAQKTGPIANPAAPSEIPNPMDSRPWSCTEPGASAWAKIRALGETKPVLPQVGSVGALFGGAVGLGRAARRPPGPANEMAESGGRSTRIGDALPQRSRRTQDTPAALSTAFARSSTTGAPASGESTKDARAAGSTEQSTAFSVWLDLNVLSKPGAAKPALPIWFESFQSEPVAAKNGAPPKTVYRLRLRRMPSLHRELLLRVFFDDIPELQPLASAWSETGREQFRSPALGCGACLPTSETIVVPLDGADYVDVEVNGDGSNIRGILASSLKEAATRQTIDFQAPAEVSDPFGNLATAREAEDDSKLFGRVKATLDTGVVRLSRKESPTGVWEFQLASQPLTTVVTFEILNADLFAPPVVSANDSQPGWANVHWPDLADPGFRGEARPLEPSMRFQYTGWVRAQFVIPGNLLHSGVNKITVSLPEDSGPVAIRNVELQLKHNWRHFDYLLTPANQ